MPSDEDRLFVLSEPVTAKSCRKSSSEEGGSGMYPKLHTMSPTERWCQRPASASCFSQAAIEMSFNSEHGTNTRKIGACTREVASWVSCGDWGGIRKREMDMLPRFSGIIDKRAEVEMEESLQLEAFMNRRRRGDEGSGVLVEDDDSRMRLQGLKYDWRMIKSVEGAGRGRFERKRSDLLLPDALDCGMMTSALCERLWR